MNRIPKIVLTGGPCGGKTKALPFLKEELSGLGYKVYTIEEATTKLFESDFGWSEPTLELQLAIARLQIKLEDELEEIDDDKAVIICDRGLMDCRVYLEDEDYEKIKRTLGMTDIDLRDRYDAVFHMDSASVDDGGNYITHKGRRESREEASYFNSRSLKAWCGNPHYRFIPFCDNFSDKLAILIREVKAFLGIPKPLEIERKFLIRYPDTNYLMSLVCAASEIDQTYLFDDNGRYRLRRRGEGDSCIYIRTEKKKISDTVREEVETRLTEEEYFAQMLAGKKMGSISKKRYCLMYDGVYYEIDIFPFWKKQAYLEVELLNEDDEVKIPDFIEVIREVSHDPAYRNSSLCNRIPEEDI